jgi:hypothetical protein
MSSSTLARLRGLAGREPTASELKIEKEKQPFGQGRHMCRPQMTIQFNIFFVCSCSLMMTKDVIFTTRGGERVVENAGEIWGDVMNVMNATKAMVVVVGLLLAATPADAMTGQEFLQAYDKSAEDEAAALKPLVRQFVREGYHKVPDWTDLGEMVRPLILEKGYRDEDIAEIAREAAIANGMSK